MRNRTREMRHLTLPEICCNLKWLVPVFPCLLAKWWMHMKRTCSVCKEEKDIEDFFKKSTSSSRRHYVCKVCSGKRVTQRMINMKIRAIEYKGGECRKCGIKLIDSHYCIFDFHHTDQSTKEIGIAKMRGFSWERVKIELDKCELLCANCHRLEHCLIT